MYWTLELARYLEDAPWPAAKDELIDFAMRTGSPLEVVENLQAIEDEGEIYDTIEEIWLIIQQKMISSLTRTNTKSSFSLLLIFLELFLMIIPTIHLFCFPKIDIMFDGILKKLFGDKNKKDLDELLPVVESTNQFSQN